MASHHQVAHKGGSDLRIAFMALVGGMLWIVAIGAVAYFMALSPSSESADPTHEAAPAAH